MTDEPLAPCPAPSTVSVAVAQNALTLVGSLVMIACGPPPAGFESTSDSTSESSGNSTSTDSEPSDTTSESTHATFIPSDQPPEHESCDPWKQDCDEGEKCVPIATSGGSWDAHACVPVNGDQAPGEPCIYAGKEEGTDDCDATSMCWNVIEKEGELVGECLPFCMGTHDDPVCPADSHCPISGDGTINVCLPTCDPVAQGCRDGLACTWAQSKFLCVVSLDDIPAGEPCGFINDCAPGLACITAEVVPDCNGSSCCSPYCDLELGDQQCASLPGTSCSSWFEPGMAPPGYEHVGVCISS